MPSEFKSGANVTGALKVTGDITRGGDSVYREGTVSTADAAATTIDTITLDDDSSYLIETTIVGIRTDAGFEAADRAAYIRRVAAYRDGGGGATFQGPVRTPHTSESKGNLNATMTTSGNDVLIQVTGRAGEDYDWRSTTTITKVTV